MPIIAAFLYLASGAVLYLALQGNNDAYVGALAIFVGAVGATVVALFGSPADPIMTLL